ncbi:hypothetical protein F5X68DRAFT_262119 [Plectosphaerella plurivora]|uniref:Imidazoleglycerol-phosphate dehydratase n=1 Tax=Plectosphaerella plurivora TaxID=936078 RepID=A0A9P8VC04_9PEZI|nr:hypothetical protein F5X68DRAFT_262119 [Plectosphaerella plurivora]
MMSHDKTRSAEADDAAWEATKGAFVGAARWGAGAAVVGLLGYKFSPVYRGLTFQFKVYLQMCGMVVGSMLESDHSLRRYEERVRMERRIARDRAKWQRYEDEYVAEEPKSQ